MIFARLLGWVFDLLLLPLRVVLRLTSRRALPPRSWLAFTIDGPIVDVIERPRFWQLRRQVRKVLSLRRLDDLVIAASADDRVKGLVVTLRSMSAGMAMATALRDLLAKARAAGKEVVVHLPLGGGTKEVYVASVANKVLLGPASQLAPLGFRSNTHYVKRALDHVGVEPQIFACGEFKSAGETLVRESMSPEQRAQLERLLATFHDTVIAAIASGRDVTPERARALIDEGPYFGRAAVDAGLADDLAYDDELPARLGCHQRLLIDAGAYLAHKERRLLRRVLPRPVIAVVRVHGTIAHAGGLLSEASTDERVIRTVRAVRQSRRVRGVILHVDSPGGSALASDSMHHEIAQLAKEKPLVVCMANVAASGGYYVAAPAACIVAAPTTITGSIGVVAARVSIAPLLERLGITTEVVQFGARAELLAGTGPLDDDARGALRRELDATYRQFIGVVAQGREMAEADVERVARGRVYTGKDALDAGLVDVLGGFDVAVAEVKKLLLERDRDRVEVTVARTPRGHLSPLAPPEPRKAAWLLLSSLLPPSTRALVALAERGERVLALAPLGEI